MAGEIAHLGEAEVQNFRVSTLIDKDIRRLDVPVNTRPRLGVPPDFGLDSDVNIKPLFPQRR